MKHALASLFALICLLNTAPLLADVGHPPGMLGLAVDEVLPAHVEELSLPGEFGARVVNLGPGSPAEAADLRPGDVVVYYNGIRVESARAFQRMVRETPAGRKVELRVIREGSAILIQPTLGEGAREIPTVTAAAAPRSLGVWIESIAPAVGQYLGLDEGVGVIVREVQAGSAADQAGIKAQDVLTHIGTNPIKSPEGVNTTIKGLSVPLAKFTVIRGSETLEISVRF